MSKLKRLCLDTNVYIIGIEEIDSPEARILESIGFLGKEYRLINAEIILSHEIIDQIRRVGKYLWNKDQAGFVIGLIWSRLNFHYVNVDEQWRSLLIEIVIREKIPSEDLEIYLTAKLGLSDCFVSSNRELIKAIADFECLTPTEFVEKYL
ncbi:MAG: hypothetical protein AAGF26_09575 [Cyanobacteria bacterium P01_G01_bin.49]